MCRRLIVEMDNTRTFADEIFAAKFAFEALENSVYANALDLLVRPNDLVPRFDEILFDGDDSSIEFRECNNDFTLTKEQQKVFFDMGFEIIYLSLCNGRTVVYNNGQS